jgi:hypothetical protein
MKEVDLVKRLVYLATAALLGMMILMPSALAQDMSPGDTDPCSPEPSATVVTKDELQRVAGQPPPSQEPTSEPPVSCPPLATSQPLPQSGGGSVGGPVVVLPAAAAALLGSGVLAYGFLRRR